MKYFLLVFLFACSTSPIIVEDISKPSIAGRLLENTAINNDHSYFWILWYVPICLFVLVWVWSYFIKKQK